MKRIILASLCLLVFGNAQAQETYSKMVVMLTTTTYYVSIEAEDGMVSNFELPEGVIVRVKATEISRREGESGFSHMDFEGDIEVSTIDANLNGGKLKGSSAFLDRAPFKLTMANVKMSFDRADVQLASR